MKQLLTCFVFLLSYGCFSQELQRKTTLMYDQVPLEKVLEDLRQLHGLKFSYSEGLIPWGKKITLEAGLLLEDVLANICAQAGLEFRAIGEQIALAPGDAKDGMISIQGRITDDLTGLPLAFASVGIMGHANGTVTNDDGKFQLYIPSTYISERLFVSFMGYKTADVPINGSIGFPLEIALEQETIILGEFEVKSNQGESILAEALSLIRQNYPPDALKFNFFIRDLTFENDEPIQVSEGMYEGYRNYSEEPQTSQVKFRSGRRRKDYAAYQNILTTFPRWTGFDTWTDPRDLYRFDLGKLPEKNDYLGAEFFRQHDFEFLGLSKLNNKNVFVIAFDQLEKLGRKALYKGKIYIDETSMAFVKVEWALSPKGIKNARFMTSKAMAKLFGFGECRIEAMEFETTYKEVKGKWYLHTYKNSSHLSLVRSKRGFASDIHTFSELVITDFESENTQPFEASELIDPGDYRFRSYYDDRFWEGNNIIATDDKFERHFASIIQRNPEMDKTFWSRYRPYKNNPNLLEWQDSHESPGTPSVNAGNRANTPHANAKLLVPAFPVLSQSLHSSHFAIYFTPSDSVHAKEMSRILENNYQRILDDFRLKEIPVVTVEVYPSIEHYHFAIGRPQSPQSDVGMATDNTAFKIVSPSNPGSYHNYESIMKAVVHEFAHCVHYNFVESLTVTEAFDEEEAFWLFEAMACYEAGQSYDPTQFQYLLESRYPTLDELNDVEGNGKIYDLGYVIIEFVKATWGMDGLFTLLQQNGNTNAAFGLDKPSFEKEFYAFLSTNYLSNKKR